MILELCFHIVKHTPLLSPPILPKGQKIAKKKHAKLPPCHDPIVTKSRIREMSTSSISPHEENAQEITLLKEQMAEMTHMMQQQVEEWGQNSSDHSQGGLQTENENQPPLVQNQGHNVSP